MELNYNEKVYNSIMEADRSDFILSLVNRCDIWSVDNNKGRWHSVDKFRWSNTWAELYLIASNSLKEHGNLNNAKSETK